MTRSSVVLPPRTLPCKDKARSHPSVTCYNCCMRGRRLLLLLSLTALPASGISGQTSETIRLAAQISPDRLMESVWELSRMEGRQSGTPGGNTAAAYIANRLPQAVFQSFPLRTSQTRSPVHARIRTNHLSKTLQIGADFLPVLSHVPSVLLTCPVVFVGYGIADSTHGIDEYADLSVTRKAVLFLRGQPKSYAGRVTHRDKVRTARAKGAIAYLTVTGPVMAPYEQRRGMSRNPMGFYDGETVETLPGLWIAPAVAEALLEPIGVTLESFQLEMDRTLVAHPLDTQSQITIEMEQSPITATATNVVALWTGSDPAYRNETIILGAHYDHFGTQGGLVFPGADDNASGTAVLLEVARVLASTGARPKRSILLLAFAGEEQGLVGSQFYVSHPDRPLLTTRAMINVDHAGVGNGKITVGLSRLDKASAQAAAVRVGLGEKLELFGFFPGGDHVPFADAAIPTATIVSSGPHADFHQPTDTPEKVNPEILSTIARYTLSLLWTLADETP